MITTPRIIKRKTASFIQKVFPSPIAGISADTFIGLAFNEIAELRESSFRPMLEAVSQGAGSLSLYGRFPSRIC